MSMTEKEVELAIANAKLEAEVAGLKGQIEILQEQIGFLQGGMMAQSGGMTRVALTAAAGEHIPQDFHMKMESRTERQFSIPQSVRDQIAREELDKMARKAAEKGLSPVVSVEEQSETKDPAKDPAAISDSGAPPWLQNPDGRVEAPCSIPGGPENYGQPTRSTVERDKLIPPGMNCPTEQQAPQDETVERTPPVRRAREPELAGAAG